MKSSVTISAITAAALMFFLSSSAWAKVKPDAVWNPGEDVIRRVKDACADERDVTKCFAKRMREEGASRQAVRFAKSLPTFGILRELREAGKVDIAYVLYPFRANENYGVFLVNGRPSKVDVDDQALLPKDDIKSDPLYEKIDKRYHGFGLWPGDRFSTDKPTVETPKGGGQWFAVEYIVTSGCRACEEVATARFGFDFDKKGKFLGAKFIRLVGR